MPTPFEFAGRFYRFTRSGNEYRIERDDGLIAWDTYPIGLSPLSFGPVKVYHAYSPAFATVTECKAAIRGERQPTYYHRLVFAETAYQAAKIAEQEDVDHANI